MEVLYLRFFFICLVNLNKCNIYIVISGCLWAGCPRASLDLQWGHTYEQLNKNFQPKSLQITERGCVSCFLISLTGTPLGTGIPLKFIAI